MTTSIQASQSSLKILRGLLPFLAPYKRQFAFAGIALLIAAGATLTVPYAFKQMIDVGFHAGAAASGAAASGAVA
ncbi:MAG: ABC transporter, partial [Noviherbaspirillum sp.]